MNINKIKEKVLSIALKHHFHKDRQKALEAAGYKTEIVYMGSGGIGQIKYFPRLNLTRIQVGCGYGRNNRALCVVVKEKDV
jgi:hypothetical protein